MYRPFECIKIEKYYKNIDAIVINVVVKDYTYLI